MVTPTFDRLSSHFYPWLGLLLFLLALLPATSSAQAIEAQVDREQINRGETLELTIRVYEQRPTVQLDLTDLQEDFDVLNRRSSSQIRSINGQVEAWTDYIITLFPQKEGTMTIPPLEINGEFTDPIEIEVVNAGPQSNQGNGELFLEIEVNKDSVFVQEQLLFTVRLFYTISGIRNPQFTELEMPDSVIQLIGSPNQYEKLIDGVRYGVYEKRYVIFPQRSGEMLIPDILFRGEVTDGSSNFVFRNMNTRRVTAFIEGRSVEVKERPPAVQLDGIWLPASEVVLEEAWSADPANLQIGESIYRTVTLEADGLDGAVLPPFLPGAIEGVNLYPDPSDIQRTFVEGSIVGTRIEKVSMVPTDSGIIEIPEVSIPWWNVASNQLEYATIPARQMSIASALGVLPAEQTVASSGELKLEDSTVPVLDQDMIDEQNQAETIEVDANWMNYLIALSVIVVLFSVYKLVLSQHKAALAQAIRNKSDAMARRYSPAENERIAYNNLIKAAGSNDLLLLRESLIVWASHFFAPLPVNSMDDLLKQKSYAELKEHCLNIQNALFNHSESTAKSVFDAAKFKQLIYTMRTKKLRSLKKERRDSQYQLPPLYKT